MKNIIIQNHQLILNKDLAKLYQVETRTLKQAMKKNKDEFLYDFMFEITEE